MVIFARVFVLCILIFSNVSCASYRPVLLTKGADSDGQVRDFYAVAQNNVVIPEYVVNERGEYPTDPKTAWSRFQERRTELEPKMRAKYKLPSNAGSSTGRFFLTTAYVLAFPISYPIYAFGGGKSDKSPAGYFDLMVYGAKPKLPQLKDEFDNY